MSSSSDSTDTSLDSPTSVASSKISGKEKANDLAKFTYEDLRLQMASGKQWCAIHGKVYDITNFIPTHPGGSLIRTAIGRDATILYETHHNLLDINKINKILEKYLIGEIEGYQTVAKFDSEFAKTMLSRCREAVKGMSHRESLYSTSALLTLLVIAVIVFYFAFTTGNLFLTPAIGFLISAGHVAGHAGNHWSLFESDTLNGLVSIICTNLWGLYEKNWEFSHVISHHCYNYTNRDYIIEQHVPSQFYRVRECDPWKPIHAYQHYFYQVSHIVAFIVGGLRLDCAPWIFISPLLRSLQRNKESIFPAPQFFAAGSNCLRNELHGNEDGVGPQRFFIFYENYDHLKSIVIGNLVWLPLFLTLWRSHGLLHAIAFNTFVFGSQAAFITRTLLAQHVCEGISLRPDYQPTDDWYAMQVESSTTIERSSLGKWLGFALSNQIEHHMFPCANPALLLKLQPIVQQTAKEFGVDYHHFPSEKAALRSVYNHFKKLSVKPVEE